MAAPVATKEPLEIFAGDSLSWSKTLSDFPATEWTLTYRILAQQGAAAQTLTATADGSDFLITVDAENTADWVPATYQLIGFVESSSERVQIYSGKLTVKPDPATVTALDSSTYLEKILAKLEAVILKGVIRAPIRYSYGGVSTEILSLKDALDARDRIKAQIEHAVMVASGTQRRILTRFRMPR